jgi:hypothetical protein
MEYRIESASRDQSHPAEHVHADPIPARCKQYRPSAWWNGKACHRLTPRSSSDASTSRSSCVACLAVHSLLEWLPAHTQRARPSVARVQGTVTTSAITIQRSPGLLTDRSRLERALSRSWPRRLDLATPASLQCFVNDQVHAGTKVSTMSSRSWRLTAKGDHRARLST